jgi:signal-transduction protein with cAMP-binding, CBS, and nucleotidyltransferase domain
MTATNAPAAGVLDRPVRSVMRHGVVAVPELSRLGVSHLLVRDEGDVVPHGVVAPLDVVAAKEAP